MTVFLNHFFLTLDKPTFAAVKAQDWMRTERVGIMKRCRDLRTVAFLYDRRELGQYWAYRA